MLAALGPHGRTLAHQTGREQACRCPACGEPVTLKRGRVVVAHFAHRPASACSWGTGESAAHLAAKRAFLDALAARGLDVEAEAEVLSGEGDRRADILVRHPATGARVAIEIQHSALALDAIEARSRAYAAAGVAVIWVPTLAVARLAARPLGDGGLRHVERYAAPPWQRWIDALGGATWFWDAGRLWRGWLSESWLARGADATTDPFADTGWRPSRRWTGLTLEGPFVAGDLRIHLHRRGTECHDEFTLPAGPAATFVVADERRAPPAPTRSAWSLRRDYATPTVELVDSDARAIAPPRSRMG